MAERVKQSHVSSIEIIHQYNPSRRLNRCIKTTAKQMHVILWGAVLDIITNFPYTC